jgi:hypothetical protein
VVRFSEQSYAVAEATAGKALVDGDCAKNAVAGLTRD